MEFTKVNWTLWYRKEYRETQTHLKHSSDVTQLKPVPRQGKKDLPSPSWIVDSRDVEEHSPETPSFSFSSDVTKNSESVSIILECPTLHPIQTHSPVSCLNLQALWSFFPPFHFIFLPTLSPHWANRPMEPIRKPDQQHALAPLDRSQAYRMWNNIVLLFVTAEDKGTHLSHKFNKTTLAACCLFSPQV